jgi:hypothetical protein
MPGFDGTGPRGMGSRTGGGRGVCPPGAGQVYGANYAGGIWAGRGSGRGGVPWGGGRGRAWGGGRGRGWYDSGAYAGPAAAPYGYPAAGAPEQELAFLQNQASALNQEIERIRARIDELQSRDTQK